MDVSISGTKYRIVKKKYNEDEAFNRLSIDGYCDGYQKLIVYCDMSTYPGWQHEPEKTVKLCEKHTLRHEIVHAFLNESGLSDNSLVSGNGWATNEEMVDWIASRGPLIYEAWREAGAL